MADSFIMYRSFHTALSHLSNEEYGQMMKIINEYALDGKEPEECSELMKVVFILIKPQIDANNERHQKHIKSVEDGKKGGRQASVNKDEVMSLYTEGKTPAEIAEKMNCSRQLVYKIVNNGTVNSNEKKEKSVNVDKKSVNSLQKSVNVNTVNNENTVNSVNNAICKQTINDNVNVNLNVNDDEDENSKSVNVDKGIVDKPEKSSSSLFTPDMVKGRLASLGVSLSDNSLNLIARHIDEFLPQDKKKLSYLDFLVEKARSSYKSESGSEKNWIHWYLTVDFKHNMYTENLQEFDGWIKGHEKAAETNIDRLRKAPPKICPKCGKSIVERTPNVFYCSSCNSIIEFNKFLGLWKAEKMPESSLEYFKNIPAAREKPPEPIDIF